MNFTTELPKRDPVVSYIVASAVKCEKFFPEVSKNEGPVFRMHAVMLAPGSSALDEFDLPDGASQHILCHVRSVDKRKLDHALRQESGPRTRRSYTEDFT